MLTRLNGAGDAVTGTGDVLANLVGGGLLGVGGNCRMGQCPAVADGKAGDNYSSQTPARRDPCGGCQTF